MIEQCTSNRTASITTSLRKDGKKMCHSSTQNQRQSSSLVLYKAAVLATGKMSQICSDQYVWVCLIKTRPNIQVLTNIQTTALLVYSLYTRRYDATTEVQASDGIRRESLILVPILFHKKWHCLSTQDEHGKRDLGFGCYTMFTFLFFIMSYSV